MNSELLLPVQSSYCFVSCMWLPYCHSPSTVVFHITLWQEWAKPQRELLSHREMLFYVTGKRHPAVRTAATLMTSTLIAAVAAHSFQWLHLPALPLWIFRAAWNSGFSSTVIISGWKNVPGSELSIAGKGTWLWILAYGQIFLLWSWYCCDSFINGQHAREDCHLI